MSFVTQPTQKKSEKGTNFQTWLHKGLPGIEVAGQDLQIGNVGMTLPKLAGKKCGKNLGGLSYEKKNGRRLSIEIVVVFNDGILISWFRK